MADRGLGPVGPGKPQVPRRHAAQIHLHADLHHARAAQRHGLWTRLCDPAPDNASTPTLFRAALTWRLYDLALRLAVAYPLLLLVGQWVVTGAEGRVGSFVVLPEADFWPERAA